MQQEQIEIQIQNRMHELVDKINQLIIGERKRFIQQYGKHESVAYRTVTDKSLTDWRVEQHLTGNMTLGCFYKGSHSKFLVYDIDKQDPSIPLGLIRLLKGYGFQSGDLHLEVSGTKGWHLWIFFNFPLPIDTLAAFGNFVREVLGASAKSIELRPEDPMTSRRHQASVWNSP
ncbi:TOTE conflict system archaeo-eukaryotic primase domain-containing protein [Cohnella terricola]|uniref:TOTE conflict system primase domain-containing protein n=1 Tax=Cohnella terricola TaxID=1289167 RepID=A0A559JDK0_9BACL|nr:hypothetical protein [Cohnella terricola]TVX97951.1 hypothetical protein FPZ45_17040 [Cohnella terricola]